MTKVTFQEVLDFITAGVISDSISDLTDTQYNRLLECENDWYAYPVDYEGPTKEQDQALDNIIEKYLKEING